MKLWYFCPLREDDEGFGAAVQNAVRRYAAHFSLTILFPDKTLKFTTTGHYCMQSFISGNSIVRGFVAEEFALSYEAQLAVRSIANSQKLPDVIVFPEKDAFAYYTVLYSYIDSEYYKQCSIFTEPSAKAADDFPKYLLPYWWIAQLSAFCLENSRGAVPVNSDEFVQMINSTQGADFAPNVFPLLTKRVQTPPAVVSNKAGLLTVIIPFYNLGNSLSETLESAFNSDYPSLEIILIDDGSTDADSLRVLESEQLKYPSLQVIHQKNQGLSAVRNLGAALAKGEFITYLDADDMVMPKYYSRCISLLQQYNNIGYVGSWLQLFGESSDIVPYFQSSLPALLLYNSQASFCVSRKDVYSSFGQNKESMCVGFEDHDAWLSLAENGWFGIMIPETLCNYRISHASMSAQFSRDITHEKHMRLFETLQANHAALYHEYQDEVYNLITCNGPGYLWNGTGIRTGVPDLLTRLAALENEFNLARNHIQNLENSRVFKLINKLKGR